MQIENGAQRAPLHWCHFQGIILVKEINSYLMLSSKVEDSESKSRIQSVIKQA